MSALTVRQQKIVDLMNEDNRIRVVQEKRGEYYHWGLYLSSHRIDFRTANSLVNRGVLVRDEETSKRFLSTRIIRDIYYDLAPEFRQEAQS